MHHSRNPMTFIEYRFHLLVIFIDYELNFTFEVDYLDEIKNCMQIHDLYCCSFNIIYLGRNLMTFIISIIFKCW